MCGKNVCHYQNGIPFPKKKKEGKIVKILIFFSMAKKNPLMVPYFLSRNTFSIKLVCHTENRFILETLVKINSYLTKSPCAKRMKSVYYSRLKLNIFSTSSYPLAFENTVTTTFIISAVIFYGNSFI